MLTFCKCEIGKVHILDEMNRTKLTILPVLKLASKRQHILNNEVYSVDIHHLKNSISGKNR